MENDTLQTVVGHVKVMRSHDYCHFEFQLPIFAHMLFDDKHVDMMAVIDRVRKDAMRLADKAVEQYKTAKTNSEIRWRETHDREHLIHRMQDIEKIPEGERTVNQQAELKEFHDRPYKESRAYDYEDEWNGDENEEGY